MTDREATELRAALKRFDAWVGTTVGGKDDHISGDLRLIGHHAREHLASHDKGEADAAAALIAEEEAAREAEAQRAADAAAEAEAAEKVRADEAEAKRLADAKADTSRHDDEQHDG